MKDTNELTGELANHFWESLAEEGITKDDIDFVDLEMGFTPVIPYRNSKEPMEVIELKGGDYCIPGTPFTVVSPLLLKVMRYRYLSNRKNPFV